MWWLIPWGIGMIGAVLVLWHCIKINKEMKKLNKLSKEGTQSALRCFYGVEENKDEENK